MACSSSPGKTKVKIEDELDIDSDHDHDHDDNEEKDTVDSSLKPHTITFKCIGVTRDNSYQTALQAASKSRKEGHDVLVRLNLEPDNPEDSTAIAFECLIGDKWKTVGHVVKEALSDVHDALNNGDIQSVKFSWVKYITDWMSPGYYAGIDISKQGDWSSTIKRCASK